MPVPPKTRFWTFENGLFGSVVVEVYRCVGFEMHCVGVSVRVGVSFRDESSSEGISPSPRGRGLF